LKDKDSSGQKHLEMRHDDDKKSLICRITKEYKQEGVEMDESCLGYKIKVLQAEIKNEHEEWLVFFPYFIMIMKKYGFDLMKRTPFESYPEAKNITEKGEQELSFLNTSFAFRKEREVFAPAKLNYIVIPLK
jgi:hypothetical protein